MMPRSSAWFIPYDLRPSKQIERKIVFECLQAAKATGVPVSELPYVGMGGVRYIDFLLANKLLGIQRFKSVEHDQSIVERCEYNKPFQSLSVFDGTSADFIDQVGFPQSSVVWFDYERGVSADLKDDMIKMAGAISPRSFIFVTATAELPAALKAIKGLPKRLEALLADIAPLGAELTSDDLNVNGFEGTAARILLAALTFGFSGRLDGEFKPFLRLNYKDSTWMTTVGGYFGPAAEGETVLSAVEGACGFLRPKQRSFVYQVQQFNITDAERRLFDRASLSDKGRRSERMRLKRLGFRVEEIDQYRELMRFIPRYFEALI